MRLVLLPQESRAVHKREMTRVPPQALLTLSEPPAGDYRFICLPLRLEGLDGAPARAVLIAD